MAHDLEQYYCGDEAWQNYSALFVDVWKQCDFQAELVELLSGHTDIAMVVFAIIGKNCVQWVSSCIPALDNLTSIECTQNPLLVKRLREAPSPRERCATLGYVGVDLRPTEVHAHFLRVPNLSSYWDKPRKNGSKHNRRYTYCAQVRMAQQHANHQPLEPSDLSV